MKKTHRSAIILGTVLVGALIAGTAWTSSAPETRSYLCNDGDHFIVEMLGDHVRLRNGSGVFALSAVKPGLTWSDGRMILRAGTSSATLEQPELGLHQQCSAAGV